MSEPSPDRAAPPVSAPPVPPSAWEEWKLPLGLLALTFLSTFYTGSTMELGRTPGSLLELGAGWVFAVPLMAILLAHELGHYVVGRRHGIDISPPYFIPLPVTLLGTLGAVISIRERIRSRNALLDVGAAGPIAGLVVALPILVYGLATSEVGPLPEATGEGSLIMEGHSILYELLLLGLHGPIPEGHDIMLSSTALAGWAGLLVTMINLVPFGQLDGGHVAYALLGRRQHRVSRALLVILPLLAVVSSVAFGLVASARGETLAASPPLFGQGWLRIPWGWMAGMHWLIWAGLLGVMTRVGRKRLRELAAEHPAVEEELGPVDEAALHPPVDDDRLSGGRRAIGVLCAVLFVLLFMPSWLRIR